MSAEREISRRSASASKAFRVGSLTRPETVLVTLIYKL